MIKYPTYAPPLWELTLIGALYAGFSCILICALIKVSAACYCGTFDQYYCI